MLRQRQLVLKRQTEAAKSFGARWPMARGPQRGSIGLKVEFYLGNFPGKREVKDEFKL